MKKFDFEINELEITELVNVVCALRKYIETMEDITSTPILELKHQCELTLKKYKDKLTFHRNQRELYFKGELR